LQHTNHALISDYSEVRVIGAGADAVDIALINSCKAGDIVITQDYLDLPICEERQEYDRVL